MRYLLVEYIAHTFSLLTYTINIYVIDDSKIFDDSLKRKREKSTMVFVFLLELKRFDVCSRLARASHVSYIINSQICLVNIDIVRYKCTASVAERTARKVFFRVKYKSQRRRRRALSSRLRTSGLACITMPPRIRQD